MAAAVVVVVVVDAAGVAEEEAAAEVAPRREAQASVSQMASALTATVAEA